MLSTRALQVCLADTMEQYEFFPFHKATIITLVHTIIVLLDIARVLYPPAVYINTAYSYCILKNYWNIIVAELRRTRLGDIYLPILDKCNYIFDGKKNMLKKASVVYSNIYFYLH